MLSRPSLALSHSHTHTHAARIAHTHTSEMGNVVIVALSVCPSSTYSGHWFLTRSLRFQFYSECRILWLRLCARGPANKIDLFSVGCWFVVNRAIFISFLLLLSFATWIRIEFLSIESYNLILRKKRREKCPSLLHTQNALRILWFWSEWHSVTHFLVYNLWFT